jgi:hypothetical protein
VIGEEGPRGEWSGGITARTEADTLCLRFRVRHRGDAEWTPVEQRVPIIWTACHFGGHRPWFRCNNCSGRAAVLYSAGELFACRRCCGLAYASQQEPLSQRGLLKAQKIRERLGGDLKTEKSILESKDDFISQRIRSARGGTLSAARLRGR